MTGRDTRDREISTAAIIGQLGATFPILAGPTVVQTTTLAAYPTTAQSYYACQIVTVGGLEAEGQAYTVTTTPATILVANVGTQVPPKGTRLRAEPIDGRNVMAYYGG